MAPDPDGRDVVRAAELAGVHGMILRLPHGYQTLLEDGGMPLSGGQRQRIGLARALYGDPRLVVLDEPNANLDAEGEALLMSALNRLREAGATVIIVTHRPQALRRADRVLVLDQGAAVRLGPRDAVIQALADPVRAA
jgi:ABC-type protease/lipase transport system fused ATPase/permease subunit